MAEVNNTNNNGTGPTVAKKDVEIEISDEGDDTGKFSMLQACALNTLNMFGTGPFITIPILLAEVSPAGPHALIGYALAAFICMNDSLVWGELGAMFPTSGGSYTYLNELYGRGEDGYGRFMAFMFVWQFLISGPLEVASGFVAIGEYLSYITGEDNYWVVAFVGIGFGCLTMGLLYRDISDVTRITLTLWVGTVSAILFTVIAGMSNFHVSHFELPNEALSGSTKVITMLGVASRVGIYDFTGYYDINFVGDQVRNPTKTIPRSCVFTCCAVCLVFFSVYIAVIAAIPWDGPDGFVALYNEELKGGNAIMGVFCERLIGEGFAVFFVLVVMYTIFGSCFSLLLGYASIPMAAAREGHFFKWFDHEHPTNRGLADRSLLVFGLLSCIGCLLPLETLVEGFLTTRLFVQYIAQSAGVIYYRHTHPEAERPWKIPLYPLPNIICIVGFTFVFFTTSNYMVSGDDPILDLAVLFMIIGALLYPLQKRAANKYFDENNKKGEAVPTVDPAEEEVGVEMSAPPPTAAQA